MTTVVALPSHQPGGMESALADHFGHCDVFTLVTLDGDRIAEVEVVPNVPHTQGGCMAPVRHLADHDVRILIAGGMGMRPLTGFGDVGIMALHHGGAASVHEAVTALTEGRLANFDVQLTCGGGAHSA